MIIEKTKTYFLQKTFDSKKYDDIWDINNFDGKILSDNELDSISYNVNFLKQKKQEATKNKNIIYKLNEYGYRTFEKINDVVKDNTVACFGCSNTFGIALNIEETWPYKLNEYLGFDNWIVKNYGVNGASNDCISRLIYNYVINNKPKAICCLFPDFFRMEFFDANASLKSFVKESEDNIKKFSFMEWEFYKAYKKISNEENSINNFIRNFKFIKLLCDSKNIKLYWSSWSKIMSIFDDDFIKQHLDYDSYINPISYEKHFDYACDNLHIGPNISKKIAEGFYKKITLC